MSVVYFGHDFYKIVYCFFYAFELKILTKKKEQGSVLGKNCFLHRPDAQVFSTNYIKYLDIKNIQCR